MTGIQVVDLILLLLGAILFLLGTFGVVVPRTDRPALNLVALGLFCWILVPLINLIHSL
jgi:hypothetical protein